MILTIYPIKLIQEHFKYKINPLGERVRVLNIPKINKTLEIYQNSSVTKKSGITKGEIGNSRDFLTLSNVAKDYQIALAAVKNASDIREDKIAEIKESIKSKKYNVSVEEVCDKILNSYFNISI